MLRSVKSPDGYAKYAEALFEFATMGILITDAKGIINAINPYALKEFGYTKKEILNKSIQKIIPREFRKLHRLFNQKQSNSLSTRLLCKNEKVIARKKNGKELPAEINMRIYKKDNAKHIIVFITNLSERKKAEANVIKLNGALEQKVVKRTTQFKLAAKKLEQSYHLLEKAASFQKAILDNAGAMIVVTDEKGIIQFFNPEAAENTGYTSKKLINRHTPMILHKKEDINQKRKIIFKEFGVLIETDFDVMTEKAKRNIHEEEPYTFVRKDGTTFPVLLSITAIRNNKNSITGFMGIAIDISDRKKMEEELKLSLLKEKELNELKSRFVSMASHEFRTPLSTVLSSAYLIEKYGTTEEQVNREKHLKRIVSSVNTLTDILNDFLNVGRIEEGKIQVRPTVFNLKEIITNFIHEFDGTLKKGQEIIHTHTGREDILLDVSLFKHILMNLVSNASKFSGEGKLIEINTNNQKTNFSLSVKDNGIGITKEDQKHLMERFFRGANAGNIQGTGLGLHIVSKYAELMNGEVTCNSELEKGSIFTIIFKKNIK
ncbi:MAG: PAS domain S-box protein [Sphingobacteriales bacterium]|nr:PAS domain S-box protein [Sphingobacteriales bacterium]